MAKSAKKSVKNSVKKTSKASKKASWKPVTKAVVSVKNRKTKKSSTKPQYSSRFPRANTNPFREGSAYAIVYDVLASHPNGITRQQLVAEVVKAGKSEKHAGYDIGVLLSAKNSPTGERHQSCREGFWIERINDHIVLKTAPKSAGN